MHLIWYSFSCVSNKILHDTLFLYLHLEAWFGISAKNTLCWNHNFSTGPQHRIILLKISVSYQLERSEFFCGSLDILVRGCSKDWLNSSSKRCHSKSILRSPIQTAALTHLRKDILGMCTGGLTKESLSQSFGCFTEETEMKSSHPMQRVSDTSAEWLCLKKKSQRTVL